MEFNPPGLNSTAHSRNQEPKTKIPRRVFVAILVLGAGAGGSIQLPAVEPSFGTKEKDSQTSFVAMLVLGSWFRGGRIQPPGLNSTPHSWNQDYETSCRALLARSSRDETGLNSTTQD